MCLCPYVCFGTYHRDGDYTFNAMWKNEHLSPVPKPLSTELSAQSVKHLRGQEYTRCINVQAFSCCNL